MSSTSTSSIPPTSTFTSTVHSGWLQYHIHTPTPASPLPDLSQLDGSALPQYYFTLHSTHLSYSLNHTSSPPLASIALVPSTTLQLLSSPVFASDSSLAAVDRLHYVFCLTECAGDGSGAGTQSVHVLSAARRRDMEHWLTAIRRCLISIKRPNTAAQPNSHTVISSLPVTSSVTATRPATFTTLTTAPHPATVTVVAPRPLPALSSSFPTSSPPPSSLRQPLLLPASVSPVSIASAGGSGTGSGGGGDGGEDVRYGASDWSDQHSRKICCIIC